MKKISILGILAILVIVAEFTYAMIAGWVDMKNSFLEGYNSVNVHSGTPQPEYSGLFDHGDGNGVGKSVDALGELGAGIGVERNVLCHGR